MKNELIEDLVSEKREMIDLSDWLRIHHPNIIREYEEKKSKNMIYE